MARPALHTLLLEQEAAIDDLFEAAARAMIERLRRGKRLTPGQVAKIVREELDRIHGEHPGDALTSPLGQLLIMYANAARRMVFRRAVADIGIIHGREEQTRRLRAAIPEAKMLKTVNDSLATVLVALERPMRGGATVSPYNRPDLTTVSPEAATILSAALAGDAINTTVVRAIARATSGNQAAMTVMALTGEIPKTIDDTARWVGTDRKRLADRITDAGRNTYRNVKNRFIDRYDTPEDLGALIDDLEFYLVAGFNPARRDGLVSEDTPIGEFTSRGSGKGSFYARRIGRYEMSRAYGNAVLDVIAKSDTTPAVRWDLNPAHPGSDECDDLSERSSPGLPPGCYYLGDVPFYPNHYGCVVGETPVAGPALQIGYKREYSGPLVRLGIDTGEFLTLTPNHPVLTPNGWVPAALLDVGDDVVCGSRLDSRLASASDDDHIPPRIEEVLDAFTISGEFATLKVPVAPVDFHGDGIDAEVDVVCTHGFLNGGIDAPLSEHHFQEHFVGAPVGPPLLARDRSSHASLDRVGLTALGSVGAIGDALPVLGSHGLLPEADTLGKGSLLDASALQACVDRSAGNAELRSDFLLTHPIEVELHHLVSVDVFESEGTHVYNLQTAGGWYYANRIIVHNCLCILEPVTVEGVRPQDRQREGG